MILDQKLASGDVIVLDGAVGSEIARLGGKMDAAAFRVPTEPAPSPKHKAQHEQTGQRHADAALTGDTAPSASGRLTMAGRILPAIFGPAGRNTERTSRTGTVLSSNWRGLVADGGFHDENPLGHGWRPAGGVQSGLVRCPGARFLKPGDCRARIRERFLWRSCG